ncbi:hypothetical protein GCM10011512_25400 [Tersicoccus solisilvae]|uniref:TNase-like domain-containing protein n=1 Tax=Tersicoccus solisilvae TaxID=1882339 RepID=A0ABQ1PHD5_9MICC|nr:hypothetical protein GCM10011512_25400 [Tersicoccus solisilvae]
MAESGIASGEAVMVEDAAAEGDTATVVRVIDGDTFDANLHGEVTRIRLLNVDTPETKHPNKAVQCQGPEATRALTALLPVGSTVSLDYDVERLDKYKRTLAGVTGPTGVFVNTELARLGLGVAVAFQPNVKWYDAVKKAQSEASAGKRGLFDPAMACTVPAAQQALSQTITAAGGEQTAEAATATAEALTAQSARLEALRSLLEEPSSYFAAAAAFAASDLAPLIDRARGSRARAVSTAATLSANEAARQRQAAQVAQAQRRQEAERQAAARAAAQQAAQAEAAAQQAAEAERQQAAARWAEQQQVVPAPDPAPADPEPGYHGPRCYEPGGKVWHPCG